MTKPLMLWVGIPNGGGKATERKIMSLCTSDPISHELAVMGGWRVEHHIPRG